MEEIIKNHFWIDLTDVKLILMIINFDSF